ncbi:hypothetical protein AKO1_000849 [Acrasis kona]|uniref:Uncharacterized protein n=1 Tax=Acrasis kona TaxID=1008807 RepID=A0AAW2ZDJ5_9EUKA
MIEVSFSSDGYFIMEDGNVSWCGLPRRLYNKINGRQHSLPGVKFVAIADDETYFVLFKDGEYQWNVSEEFDDAVQDSDSHPEFVALGSDGSYFIKFEDGAYCYNNIPHSLHNRLRGRQSHLSPLDKVAMDSEGGYWAQFEDGSYWWGGLGERLSDLLDDNKCQYLALGPNGRYFLSNSNSFYWNCDDNFDSSISEYMDDEDENISEEQYSEEEMSRDDPEEGSDYEFDEWIDPSDIRYTQDSIKQNFRDGSSVHELLRQLRQGMCPSCVPPIQVMQMDGDLWSVDNRRLWAFKKANVSSVPVVYVDPSFCGFYRGDLVQDGWDVIVRQ